MARKIRLRQQRIYKLKIIFVFVLFFTMLFVGLLVVDLNKNYIMYGTPDIEIFQIEMLENDICQVNLLNSEFKLNLKYLKRDINNVKSYFNIN